MDPAQLEKTQVELPSDLAKRMNDATTVEDRHAILKEFSSRLKGDKEAAAFTDDQFRQFLEKVGQSSAVAAKDAIAAIAGDAERKYNLDSRKAEELAEGSYRKEATRQKNLRKDMEVAAEVIRGIYAARQGKSQILSAALDKEAEHYKNVYGREIRAGMTLGTDSSGGYLAPTLFSDMLYENISRTSLIRKFATMIPMNGNEVINIPTLTGSLSAAVVSEAAAGTNSIPTFSQKQLTTKKIMTKTRPISIELIEKANPAIIPLLLQFAMIEIMKAEDSLVFGTSGNGIRNTSTNLVAVGTAADGYDSVEFDELINMESELTAEYLAGADIQGSGIIGGAPQYWLPHAMVQALKKKKNGMNEYLDESRELRNEKKIFGYDVQRVLSLPGSGMVSTDKVGVFGNLGHVWCGTEPGFRVDILDQATINDGSSDVSLGETAQAAVRVIEFFDSVVVDAEAFSIAQMA